MQRAVAFGFLVGFDDKVIERTFELLVTLVIPFAQTNQMVLQTQDRIAQRPFLKLVLGAIA